VSPETAAASALTGVITDPRTLRIPYPIVFDPEHPILNTEMLRPPMRPEEARKIKLVKGPNIKTLPDFEPIPNDIEIPVLLKVGDDISTDEIMPAGARVLPYRSNTPKISEFVFEGIDGTYPQRARDARGGHAIVAGRNYGQGSSREHAALAPRYLGLRIVIAQSFARIHWQNLVDYGVLPLVFEDASEYVRLEQGHVLRFAHLHQQLRTERGIAIDNATTGSRLTARHDLSERQIDVLLAGSLINWAKTRAFASR
jgi:aconitate hydratase